MSNAPSKPLLSWLQHHSDHLNVLLAQVHLLRRITHVIRRALPETLASHCHAANIDGETLVIYFLWVFRHFPKFGSGSSPSMRNAPAPQTTGCAYQTTMRH